MENKSPSYTLFMMNWEKLDQDMNDYVCKRKKWNDTAYTVRYGLQVFSALPVWFPYNDQISVTSKNFDQIQQSMKHVPTLQKTGLAFSTDEKEFDHRKIYCGYVAKKCGVRIDGNLAKVDTRQALNAFKDDLSSYLAENIDLLSTDNDKVPVILPCLKTGLFLAEDLWPHIYWEKYGRNSTNSPHSSLYRM
jgi:hypothetical protein